MKNLILALLSCFLFYSPSSAVEEACQPNVISAKGSAETQVKPDTAKITIAVETEAKKLKDAIDENKATSEKIYDSIQKILDKDDSIKTINYQVNPMYTYDKSFSPPNKLTGYKVFNQIEVKTGDINKLGDIIETALDNGANRISGLNYGISDTQAVCQGLLSEAAKNAREEAEVLAQAFGVEIIGIRKISSSCNDMQVRPFMERAFAVQGKGMDSAPPLEAGESTVTAEVFVDFIIE